MKRFLLLALAFCAVSTPALAAHMVYLKDGGVIRAKSLWRSKDMVHVLVNRDTLAEFPAAEINMKRTFASKHRIVRKPSKGVAPTIAGPSGPTIGEPKR